MLVYKLRNWALNPGTSDCILYSLVCLVLIEAKIRNVYLTNCYNYSECKVYEIHPKNLPQIYLTQEGPIPDNLREICNYTTLINVDQEACVRLLPHTQYMFR